MNAAVPGRPKSRPAATDTGGTRDGDQLPNTGGEKVSPPDTVARAGPAEPAGGTGPTDDGAGPSHPPDHPGYGGYEPA